MKPVMPHRQSIPLLLLLLLPGCVRVTVDPIVATINVNVKIDRQLDSFFDYQNPQSKPNPSPGSVAGEPAVVVPPPTTIPVRQ